MYAVEFSLLQWAKDDHSISWLIWLMIILLSQLNSCSQNFSDPLPVMVFIHGGGYTTGEAGMYMPSKLMDRDVVVVVLQYRLGTLGEITLAFSDR